MQPPDESRPPRRALPSGGTGLHSRGGRVIEAIPDDEPASPPPARRGRLIGVILRDLLGVAVCAGVIIALGVLLLPPANNGAPPVGLASPSPAISPSVPAITPFPTLDLPSFSTPSSPTPVPSPSESPSPEASATPTASVTPAPSPTPAVTGTPGPTPSPTPISSTNLICGLTKSPGPTPPPLPSGVGVVRILVACDLNADGNPGGAYDANEGPLAKVVVTMTCNGGVPDELTTGADGVVVFRPGAGADCTFAFARDGWALSATYPAQPLPLHLSSVYAGVTAISAFMSPAP